MAEVYDRRARQLALRAGSKEEYAAWKEQVRGRLREITGMNTMEGCELSPRLLGSEQMDGYRRDKLIIQTEPGVWMPLYVLVPDGAGSPPEGMRTPCVIAAHGHRTAGKLSVAGRSEIPAVKAQIGVYNNDYGVRLAQEGYIVFCPDARAFGERREWTLQGDDDESFIGSSCAQLNHMAIGLGQSLTGMWTWDLMRLADYIETRADCGAIGCVGLSGGGLQTLWLAALDDRIQAAVLSGYFYGYKDALLKLSDNCACNYVPNLWTCVDMGDLGALIAPRPLLVESGTNDRLNGERGIANVYEQVDITRQAYRLFDAERELQHFVFEGGHMWRGDQTYAFLDRHLRAGV
ncbi:hypothetical protein GZH47_11735 [Paenibacillus rhizovicinus]|uniref:Prolyl oligopeptidase family serine peptidase n=1 Tax=Paenibacillus rhizovicinus TaxID=2704463 RepID=A0A6C0P943_9BACL|nr:hypothetical protein GZH47_11735 [Paenibacillus rhizovicinus]